MTALEDVAKSLVAAFQRSPEEGAAAVGALFADTVDMRHVPPFDSDGPADGRAMRELNGREMPAFRNGMKNFRSEANARVEGNEVVLSFAYLGEVDGRAVRVPFRCDLGIKDGKIAKMVVHVDKDGGELLRRILEHTAAH